MDLQSVWQSVRNLKSNETPPISLAQKLSEIWYLKNWIWKRAILRKWLFQILVIFFTIWNCIFQQMFVLKQHAFVQERNVLRSSECYMKVHIFFHQNQWKSENRIFWGHLQKVATSRFPGSATWPLFSENVTFWFFPCCSLSFGRGTSGLKTPSTTSVSHPHAIITQSCSTIGLFRNVIITFHCQTMKFVIDDS